jgi:hypothetical protein
MSTNSDPGKGLGNSGEKSKVREEDSGGLEQKSGSKGRKKIGAEVAPREEDSFNPPRSGSGVEDVDEKLVTSEEHSPQPFGNVTDVERKKTLSEIGVRTILAYSVVGFFLLCMGAYVGYMIHREDPEGLTNAISILVGIVGLVMGYFFGKEEGQ